MADGGPGAWCFCRFSFWVARTDECAVQTQMIYLSILGKLEKPTNDDAAYLSP